MTGGEIRLTIVIPTIGRDWCLGRAVDSALAQTVPGLEVIVSNNAATDGTRAILESYDDPRLVVVHHPVRLSSSDHGSYLIGKARGRFFLGLSDDDWIEPDFAARVLELFERRPDLSFVYTGCWTEANGHAFPSATGPEVESPLEFLEAYFSSRRQVFWCGCVTRTADLRRIGPIPSNVLIGDMHYWTRIVFDGPVGCVPDQLAHYTYLADNGSLAIPVATWAAESARIVDRISARLDVAPAPTAEAIRRAMRRYLAVTTANQFVLNASRSAPKASLLRALGSTVRYLRGHPTLAALRVSAALLLRPPALRWLMDYIVRRRAARATVPAGAAA